MTHEQMLELVRPQTAWGIVPARGGSRSIRLKNLHQLAGLPLLDYVCLAGLAASSLERVICSTDHEEIIARSHELGVEVHERPAELSSDTAKVVGAVVHLLEQAAEKEGQLPEAVALLQPTSPFILPSNVDLLADRLWADPEANSAQTITTLPHVHHAFNQRVVEDGRVRFAFPEEHERAINKQQKPVFWVFGNVVLTRVRAVFEQRNLFAPPSLGEQIDQAHSFDVDTEPDFRVAEWLISTGQVAPTAGEADRRC